MMDPQDMKDGIKARKGGRRGSLTATIAILLMGALAAVHFLTDASSDEQPSPPPLESPASRPPLDPLVARFNQCWNTGDVDGMARLFAPELRGAEKARIRSLFERRGWQKKPPVATLVQDGVKINADGLGWAVMSVGREIVTTKWRYASSAWEAYSLTLPR